MEENLISNLELAHIKSARESIVGKVLLTPLVPVGNERTPGGNPIYLKAENLQPGGSFKIRGATYALSQLNEEQRSAGVIAYSTGNHAQAVALACKQLGIRATIVMSPDPIYRVPTVREWF